MLDNRSLELAHLTAISCVAVAGETILVLRRNFLQDTIITIYSCAWSITPWSRI